MEPPIYIVGAPRSGTSIFGDVLDRHPEVAHWMEPYFIFDFHTGYGADDSRTAADATDQVVRFVRKETARYQRWNGSRQVVIKLLNNSFRIPFVERIHPNARFIHMLRDGRDVALSLRERKRRREQAMNRVSLRHFAFEAWDILRYHHPYHQVLQVIYELGTRRSWSPRAWLQKSKWEGLPYFGPRPPGWRELFAGKSDLEIAAIQWATLEEHLQAALQDIPPERVYRFRYEDLLRDPQGQIGRVLAFIGVDPAPAGKIGHDLWPDNAGKWRARLSAEEKAKVAPIMDPMLTQLGYPATDT